MTKPTARLVPKRVDFNALLARFAQTKATVAIIGMGYVGFPLALATHAKGYSVLAFDIDKKKVEQLSKGKSYLKGVESSLVEKMVKKGRFKATSDVKALREVDALLMCVPTPLTKNREPDMSYVEATTHAIASQLRPGQLVILESTTYPGTTTDVIKPILEETGLKAGEDFFLAYSPEREDPGNGYFSTASIPKVVGADDDKSRKLAETLYSKVVKQVVPVSTSATAEAVKLVENIFRSVNIALVNELKVVFEKMDIDIWEVVDAAKTKPFGFMPFYPGPGVGGHCIPIDPFYLTWKSREYGQSTRFIELAGEINLRMQDHVVNKLREALDAKTKKGINGARILVLGIAYKKDVDDMRESPSLFVFEKLLDAGATVDYHDPFIPQIPSTREHTTLTGKKSVPLSEKQLKGYDAVIITTGHSKVDYALVVKHSKLVVDTRNVTAKLKDKKNVVKA